MRMTFYFFQKLLIFCAQNNIFAVRLLVNHRITSFRFSFILPQERDVHKEVNPMENNKKLSEPSAAERWVMDETHWRGKNFLDADAIYNEYHGIRKTLLSIQIVQIIQGITLLVLAAALLLR
nr:MAG TPA: hypothetical protein [Caudoviricetes sp.]